MAVRSRPFFLTTINAGATVTVYTVPSDRVAIMRTITVTNTAALGQPATVQANLGSGALAVWTGTIPAASTVSIPAPVILEEGDTLIVVNGGATGAMRAYGGGSLLDGDPS